MANDSQSANVKNTPRGEERKSRKHLVFQIDTESYGVPLSAVKEVIMLPQITPVPQVPAFFKGMINLRGNVLSVVDLRIKLALPASEYRPQKTCVIIVETAGLVTGLVVDEVVEVIGINSEQISRDLDIRSAVSRDYIIGIARAEGSKRLTILLALEKVLASAEIPALKEQSLVA